MRVITIYTSIAGDYYDTTMTLLSEEVQCRMIVSACTCVHP